MSQWDAVATVTNCLRHNSLAGEALRSRPQAADGEIVRAVLAGDRESYARLVERYRDRYARYAARMLGSADAAEDALQDAFVRAYDQLAQCKDPDNFIGWFFLILRNRCFAERRRSAKKRLRRIRKNQPMKLSGSSLFCAIAVSPSGAATEPRRRWKRRMM